MRWLNLVDGESFEGSRMALTAKELVSIKEYSCQPRLSRGEFAAKD